MLELVLSQTRRFSEREIDPAAIDRDGAIPPEIVARASSLGLFSLTIPERWGGLGLSLGEACQVIAEVARVDRSVATMLGLHAGLGTRGLVELGQDEIRDEWLPRLASGEWIASFCATEPSAGSDLTAVRTTAEPVDGGLELNGEKAYVTNGAKAGLFTVLARSPKLGGARGTSLVCVPADTQGVIIGREEDKLGLRGSSTVTVTFDGARVPMRNVLGTPGRGIAHAHRVLEWGRTLMSAGCVGTARAALEATLAHVETRRQFGRTLSSFGATRAHVASMACRLYAMEALLDHVAGLEDRNEPISLPSASLKVIASEGAFDVCDRALQLHGALGYVEDTGVARMLRDCRVTRIFEGANDVLLVHVGTALVGVSGDPGRRAHEDVPDSLAGAGARWQTTDERLTSATQAVRREHGVGAVRHQLVLQRLARAHSSLLAASAAIRRAGPSPSPRQALLASACVSRMATEAERHLDALGRAEEDEERDLRLFEQLGRDEGPAETSEAPARLRQETAQRE